MECNRRELVGSIGFAGLSLLAGCSTGDDGTPTTSDTGRHTPTRTPSQKPPGTSRATGQSGLPPVDTEGLDFVVGGDVRYPQGFNYIRLRKDADGNIAGHDTFNPDSYDPDEIERDLSNIDQQGFDLVRVFLDHTPGPGIIPEAGAESFSAPYVDNIVDFLERAAHHGIYVLLTVEWTPKRATYQAMRSPESRAANVEGVNYAILSPGHVDAHAQYMADVVAAVAERSQTALSAILAAHIRNEISLRATLEPFTLSEGTVRPANGETYDVGATDDLQAMVDESFTHYADRHVEAVAEVAPEVNVCLGMFTYTPMEVSGPGDFAVPASTPAWKARIPPRPVALTESDLDFLDIHLYLRWGERSFGDIEIEALRCAAREHDTPLLMGEFGVWEDNYDSIDRAAREVREWWERVATEGFAGHAYWTYKPNGQTLIPAMQDEGQIFQALAEAAGPATLRADFDCS